MSARAGIRATFIGLGLLLDEPTSALDLAQAEVSAVDSRGRSVTRTRLWPAVWTKRVRSGWTTGASGRP